MSEPVAGQPETDPWRDAADAAALQRAQQDLLRFATIEPLTRLPHRQAFDEQVQQALADAVARSGECALVVIGLDGFRLLNEVYGQRVGDRILQGVATRLHGFVREPNLLGRRGGDEFAVLLTGIAGADAAMQVARAMLAAIQGLDRVGNLEVQVDASAGVVLFPADGGDVDSLVEAGDAALARAKREGGRRCAQFTPDLRRAKDLRIHLEQRLRRACEARDFRLVYQPQVSLPDRRLVGAEALVRWSDAELGDISPAEFIPIAEESGLIEGLSDWVLREVCRQRQMWRQVGLDLPPIAINLSGVQLRGPDCVPSVLETIDEFQIPAEEIEVEITETWFLDSSSPLAQENLRRLKAAGVRSALDDFGVGWSSLAQLRDLPIHRLKIDRSFTVECMRNARTLTIVKAVIDMAHDLGLVVTAEGIETADQEAWMHHLGCDSAQGFHIARPMPAEDFLRRYLADRAANRVTDPARSIKSARTDDDTPDVHSHPHPHPSSW